MRVGVIGDIHACYTELVQLHKLIKDEVDEIWALGDYIHRGPDDHGVVQYCIDNNIKGIQGNHDSVVVQQWDIYKKRGFLPKNPDKAKTIQSLTEEDINYLRNLPYLHVFDNLNLVLVHGGMYNLPLYAQPETVMRMQMIHPDFPGRTKWFNESMDGTPEAELKKQGWVRWYEVYNYPYRVAYGHTVWRDVKVHKNPGGGSTYGLDTGGCFGGYLTAGIFDETDTVKFKFVKCSEYVPDCKRFTWYED